MQILAGISENETEKLEGCVGPDLSPIGDGNNRPRGAQDSSEQYLGQGPFDAGSEKKEQKGEAFASNRIRTEDLQILCKGTDQTGYGTDIV
jgi:hypothetical protein